MKKNRPGHLDKHSVRQDLNFLEYGFWTPFDRKGKNQPYVYRNPAGFEIRASWCPGHFDAKVLYYLMYRSMHQKWSPVIVCSRNEIVKGCKLSRGGRAYDRVEEALELWTGTYLKFKGSFYIRGKGTTSLQMNILQTWAIRESDSKLEIAFNPDFLEVQAQSEYYKLLKLPMIMDFQHPLGFRLYEILCKSFYQKNSFPIGAHKLAEKLHMPETYVSHIIPKIRAAVNAINKSSPLQIELEVKRPGRNQAVFTFYKVRKSLQDLMAEGQGPSLSPEPGPKAEDLLKELSEDQIAALKERFIETKVNNNMVLSRRYHQDGFEHRSIQMAWMGFIMEDLGN